MSREPTVRLTSFCLLSTAAFVGASTLRFALTKSTKTRVRILTLSFVSKLAYLIYPQGEEKLRLPLRKLKFSAMLKNNLRKKIL